MGTIIRMDSDQLLGQFVKENNHKKFNFLLVSHDIKTNGDYKNVYSLKRLLPPPNITSIFVNNGVCNKYMKAYLDYIQGDQNAAVIAALVKLAVVDDTDVILLCSEHEKQYKYTDMICQYIEALYGIKTFSYKKFRKSPKDCKSKPKDKKAFMKLLKKKMENFDPDKMTNSIDTDGLKSKLKSWDRKDLIEFCKKNEIKYDKDGSKKELIKSIMKRLSK